MVTLFSVLVLVGALAATVIPVRLYLTRGNAHARATQISHTQRAERIHQLEHELGIVTKHSDWEGCKRCHPLKPPPPKAAIVNRSSDIESTMSDIRKRIENMEKAVKTRSLELDGIDYEYYDVIDGYGRVVDRFIKTPELPAAEYLNYLDSRPAEYDMIERKPPPPAAKPERVSR